MPQPPEPFSCEIERTENGVRLRLRGEFDLAAVDEFEAASATATSNSAHSLLLDLSEVTFIDSSGLRGVLGLQAAAEQHGLQFAVVPGPAPVRRVFELAGLDEVIPLAQPGDAGPSGSSG